MAALQRRPAELLQCSLRGRPFDHSLPVPGLTPTLIVEAASRPALISGREAALKARLCAAQQLLGAGVRVIEVSRLAAAAQASTVTARKHWAHVAARLRLRCVIRRRATAIAKRKAFERKA